MNTVKLLSCQVEKLNLECRVTSPVRLLACWVGRFSGNLLWSSSQPASQYSKFVCSCMWYVASAVYITATPTAMSAVACLLGLQNVRCDTN